MSTITQEGWVYFDQWRAEFDPEGKASHFDFIKGDAMELSHKQPICKATVSFDVPDDFDPRAAQIDALNAKKKALQAQFAAAVNELNSRIASLQAIECTEAA